MTFERKRDMNNYDLYRATAQIDLGAIRQNLLNICKKLPEGSSAIAVVKAQAYGHGAAQVSKVLEDLVSAFAVAVPSEGEELREAGIKKPIYILGYSHPSSYKSIIECEMVPAIYKYEDALTLSRVAKECSKSVRINIKVDTGMRRIGFEPTAESADVVAKIASLKGVKINGVFTHFATADFEDKSFTCEQYAKFEEFIELCKNRGVEFRHITCDNTAAAMEMPVTAKTEVRIGIGLYGYYPSDEVKRDIALTPAMTIKSHIVSVKEIEAGQSVGYGRTFTAQRKTRLATIPVGYADGYPRLLSNQGYVLINGQKAPVVGNVCMDMFMVDITDIDAGDGDKVILMGKDIDADAIAKMCQTISYEIICGIGSRVKRVYF